MKVAINVRESGRRYSTPLTKRAVPLKKGLIILSAYIAQMLAVREGLVLQVRQRKIDGSPGALLATITIRRIEEKEGGER